jgi:cytochrome b involved in lipid metabolism
MWINLHPGGRDKILSICGKDGTAPFMAQHHGAQLQMDILARYYIGNLSQ